MVIQRTRAVQLNIRVDGAEMVRIREAAARAGKDLSAFIRDLTAAEAERLDREAQRAA